MGSSTPASSPSLEASRIKTTSQDSSFPRCGKFRTTPGDLRPATSSPPIIGSCCSEFKRTTPSSPPTFSKGRLHCFYNDGGPPFNKDDVSSLLQQQHSTITATSSTTTLDVIPHRLLVGPPPIPPPKNKRQTSGKDLDDYSISGSKPSLTPVVVAVPAGGRIRNASGTWTKRRPIRSISYSSLFQHRSSPTSETQPPPPIVTPSRLDDDDPTSWFIAPNDDTNVTAAAAAAAMVGRGRRDHHHVQGEEEVPQVPSRKTSLHNTHWTTTTPPPQQITTTYQGCFEQNCAREEDPVFDHDHRLPPERMLLYTKLPPQQPVSSSSPSSTTASTAVIGNAVLLSPALCNSTSSATPTSAVVARHPYHTTQVQRAGRKERLYKRPSNSVTGSSIKNSRGLPDRTRDNSDDSYLRAVSNPPKPGHPPRRHSTAGYPFGSTDTYMMFQPVKPEFQPFESSLLHATPSYPCKELQRGRMQRMSCEPASFNHGSPVYPSYGDTHPFAYGLPAPHPSLYMPLPQAKIKRTTTKHAEGSGDASRPRTPPGRNFIERMRESLFSPRSWERDPGRCARLLRQMEWEQHEQENKWGRRLTML